MKKINTTGFALLYAVLVVSAMMSLVFGILNIAYKQIALAGANKDSTIAFYSAESGLECGQYWSAYGAFNTKNPVLSFSTIRCLDTQKTFGSDSSGSSQNLIGNPLVNVTAGGQYTSYSFSYSLDPAYSGFSSPPSTQATVNVWQNTLFAPNAVASDTTAILSSGSIGSGSNQVQRGVGETAGITQCLAPAFTYQLSGGGSYPYTAISWLPFIKVIAPYFPGNSISAFNTQFPSTMTKAPTFSSYFFPYISYLPADNWSFNPTNHFATTSLSAQFLSADPSKIFVFGYYIENTSSQSAGVDNATSTFISLATSTDGVVTVAPPSPILPSLNNIHFGLEVYTNGSISSFWSTYQPDDENVSPEYSFTPGTHNHVVVLATPMPGNINVNPSNQHTRLSGKYIFGFDNNSSLPKYTYSDAIVALSLSGCP